jgi:hypothetical protein
MGNIIIGTGTKTINISNLATGVIIIAELGVDGQMGTLIDQSGNVWQVVLEQIATEGGKAVYAIIGYEQTGQTVSISPPTANYGYIFGLGKGGVLSDMVFRGGTGFNGSIYSTICDSSFIYVAGGSTTGIKKYNPRTMSLVAQSASIGAITNIIAQDNDFIYIGGVLVTSNGQSFIRKIEKSTMSIVATSTNIATTIKAISVFNDKIYVGGVDQIVKELNTSNLSLTGNTLSTYGGTVNTILATSSFIYVGGVTTNRIREYSRSTFQFIRESTTYGGTINSIFIDGSFIYAAGVTNRTVRKFNLSNLSLSASSPNYGGTINQIINIGDFIYAVGDNAVGTDYRIKKYAKSTMAFISQGHDYGDQMQTISTNGNYLFIGGVNNQSLVRATRIHDIIEVKEV